MSAVAYLSKLPPILNDHPSLLSDGETHWESRHGAVHRRWLGREEEEEVVVLLREAVVC